MDKNTVIGFLLIFGILIGWNMLTAPDRKLLEEQEQIRLDSLRKLEEIKIDSLEKVQGQVVATPDSVVLDSQTLALQGSQLAAQFGPFAPAGSGKETFEVLENDVMRVLISSKGGYVKEVELKKYFKVHFDSMHKEVKQPLKLLNDPKNRFEYTLPVAGAQGGLVNSGKLFFQPVKEGSNTIIMRANAGEGRSFEQVYTIEPGSYALQYSLRFNGLEGVLDREGVVKLDWVDYLDKLEQNFKYEATMSTVYYKPAEDDYDYCSCTSADVDDLSGQKIIWAASSNQFFASVLMAKGTPFKSGKFQTEMLPPEDADLKKLRTELQIPIGEKSFDMVFLTGPKDFEMLAAYDNDMQDIVAFGSSIFGTANRWIIRPLFNFLSGLIGIKGLVILMLTFIVKLALYPLTYKMLYSQAKMQALKPRLASLKEKLKDDPTKMQMESMKIYREFGVNPLGGCLPVVLQMPIWFALYRFFPSSIEFRQVDFLWATDLSSYDAAFWLPFEIPFYGQHVSLFTLLWVVTTIMYTYYNMKSMDMSMGGANAEMMKWMQYLMPVFFLFFFNNFASGLTCYLVFSNILNIAQTLITKNWIIDHDKINKDLEAYKLKPKKKSGFGSRIEEALKQQQALAAQRDAAAKKKK